MVCPIKVVVLGKGGSGKSVLCGTLARALAQRGHRVLALDSDPMPGLAFSLGIDAGDEAMLQGFAERAPGGEWRTTRDLKPATLVRRAARVGPDGVLFLQFGKVDGPALSPEPSSVRAFWTIAQDLRAGPWTVVHDLPAGTRQAFSGWAGTPDVVLVVVEPTFKSVLSAARLAAIPRPETSPLLVVGNKLRTEEDVAFLRRELPPLRLAASIPFDADIADAERLGLAPIDHRSDSPAIEAIRTLAAGLESMATRKEAPA